MVVEMTRLSTFNDLRVSALADKEKGGHKRGETSNFIPSLDKSDGCNLERRKRLLFWGRSQGFHKEEDQKPETTSFGLVSFPLFYFVSPWTSILAILWMYLVALTLTQVWTNFPY